MPIRLSEPSHKSLFVQVIATGGAEISTATAFVAQVANCTPFLVTNRHVVTGRNQDTDALLDKRYASIPAQLRVWFSSSTGLGYWEQVELPLYDGDGQQRWIEHPARGSQIDLVAIPLPTDRGDLRFDPYEALPFQDNKIEPAQMVSVVGFPFGVRSGGAFAVWATGFVATEPEIDHDGRPVFLIDCRTRHGQSGSPVILHHGYHAKNANSIGFRASSELLGIYSGRINEESDIGTVWKSSVIAELLQYASFLPLQLARSA
jgi:hypothetical protein